MAATAAQAIVNMLFTLSASNPFGSITTVAGSGESFTLNSLDLTVFTNVYTGAYTLWVQAPQSPTAALATGGTLTIGTAYYYKVSATGPSGTDSTTSESAASSEVTATPSSGNQSITVSWTQLSGATGYKVYRGTAAGAENLLVTTITSGTTVTWTDTGVAGSSATLPSTPNTYIEFDLSSFTNSVAEAVTAAHILTLGLFVVNNANSKCTFASGSSNGLVWFFGGTAPTITLNPGGCFFFSEMVPSSGTGTAATIDSTHKTFRITNGGTGNATVYVLGYISPT